MIRAAVFDLDNTLFDSTSVPLETLAPAMSAARRANTGPHRIPGEVLEDALTTARRQGFSVVAEAFRLPPAIRNAWRRAYRDLAVNGLLVPYPDVVPVLGRLELPRFLLTTGFRRMQESKIAALGIRHLFEAVYIDAMDERAPPGKQRLLEQILNEHALTAPQVLVLGDSAESEIAAGNALGAVTVQILRTGVTYADTARFHLLTLAELPGLLSELERDS